MRSAHRWQNPYLAKPSLQMIRQSPLAGIGDLGTAPSSWIMKNCDTVLILGSTMPWEEYYPASRQARGIQIDIKADRIGLRYPVEVGLVADVKATLMALTPLIEPKKDRLFLADAQRRMADWNALLMNVESSSRSPLRPQMVLRAVSDLLTDDAVISLDCGANTHFAGRYLRLRETGTGMLASMAHKIFGQRSFRLVSRKLSGCAIRAQGRTAVGTANAHIRLAVPGSMRAS
jgi:thiamine pyrophosphate-dependent acetolactate synthase large subunit-like protein